MNKDLLYTLRYNTNNPSPSGVDENLKILGALLGESNEESRSLANQPTPEITLSPSFQKNGPKSRVALVVGHNSRNRGAYIKGRFHQFEFDFNNDVVALMQSLAWAGLETRRFSRKYIGSYSKEIAECYDRVNAWEPDLILELHFNSAPGGNYSFMLHHYKSEKSKAAAGAMNDTWIAETGFGSNQGNSSRGPNRRGYGSMSKSLAPCILTEPFFENNPRHLAKIESMGHVGVAQTYMKGLRSALATL